MPGSTVPSQGHRSPMLAAICILAGFGSGLSDDVVPIPIKAKDAGPLFQIQRGVEWGYMNRKGKVVIRPRFENEGDFFEGLAKVRVSGNWGFIDEKGRLAIAPVFQGTGDFHEGLAPVQVGRRWGFIDHAGKVVISPQFQGAGSFSDGLALFEVWETIRCGGTGELYTRDNAPMYALRLHNKTPSFSGACFSGNASYGFVDHRGIAIAATLPNASDFSEGLAAVRSERPAGLHVGYIDQRGKTAIEPRFDDAHSFAEGLAAVEVGFRVEGGRKTGGKWGYIAHDGTFAIAPQFEDARPFSDGLAEVSSASGKWGYIDKHGAFVIAPRYEETTQFSEGLALVQNDEGESWYIDKAGRDALRLPNSLWPRWPFSDGLTVVRVVGQQEQRYVDRRGGVVADYGP